MIVSVGWSHAAWSSLLMSIFETIEWTCCFESENIWHSCGSDIDS